MGIIFNATAMALYTSEALKAKSRHIDVSVYLMGNQSFLNGVEMGVDSLGPKVYINLIEKENSIHSK